MEITGRVCNQIRRRLQLITNAAAESGRSDMDFEDMQELVKLVLILNSSEVEEDIDDETKKIFQLAAKSFYYAEYCNIGTINSHIVKVFDQKTNVTIYSI